MWECSSLIVRAVLDEWLDCIAWCTRRKVILQKVEISTFLYRSVVCTICVSFRDLSFESCASQLEYQSKGKGERAL